MIFKVIYNMNYLSYYKMYTSVHLLKKMIAVDVERPTPFVEATGYVYLIHTYRYLLIIVLFTNGLFLMIIYNQILARQEIKV